MLLPRVFAWLKRLCALALCIAILISAPCSPFAPMRLERSTQGPPVLFDSANPDGVKLANGEVHPLAEGALRLHRQGLELARDVHAHGGGVVVEHPVNHGADSMWPIRGREAHSTLFETTIFRDFTNDVPGERVFSDQCAAGAPTRKTTQWYCNEPMLTPMFKYLGVLHCPERETPDHPWPHSKTLQPGLRSWAYDLPQRAGASSGAPKRWLAAYAATFASIYAELWPASRGCHLYFDLDGRRGGASGSMACEPPCPLPSPRDPVTCDRAPEQPGEDTARCVAEEAAGVLRDLIAAQAPADIANSVVIETLTIESAHGGDKFSQHVLLQAVRSGGC